MERMTSTLNTDDTSVTFLSIFCEFMFTQNFCEIAGLTLNSSDMVTFSVCTHVLYSQPVLLNKLGSVIIMMFTSYQAQCMTQALHFLAFAK